MSDDVQPGAAPVVAVVVTHDPRPAFDELLASLADQDQPRLSVLVLDTSGRDDLPARIGAALPGAYVRRCDEAGGFGPVANEALKLVEGDSGFFCFLHDDVALDRDAVRQLVDEAIRSNAAIAGPKLVEWDDPTRLQSTGFVADKFGELYPLCDRGDLDQEQHDAVRDVFVLPSACMLVRADLFRAIGGFDPEIDLVGEDRDLCWRTHVAGGRVIVVPAARARHLGDLDQRRPEVDAQGRDQRHRLRTVFGTYSGFHLIRVVPQLVIVTIIELLAAVLTGRFRRARALGAAWAAMATSTGSLVAKRRAVAVTRQVPDNDLRRLQMHGSARLLTLLRRRSDAPGLGRGVRSAGRQVADGVRGATLATGIAVLALVAYVLVGGRTLVTGRVPVVGTMVPFSSTSRAVLRAFAGGWWDTGLGRGGSVPTGFGVLGVAGLVTGGNLNALRTIVVLGALVAGPLGAWRLARPFDSTLARAAALVVYAGTPLGVNALARGHLAGLLAYGAAPWIAARVVALAGSSPFAARTGRLADVAGVALLVAALAAVAPAVVVLPALIAAGLLAGSLVAGSIGRAALACGLTLIGTLVAIVLLLPWRTVHGGAGWGLGTLASGDDRWRFGRIARFATGPHGDIPLGLAALAVVVVALLVARGERLGWVVRGVVLGVGSLLVALAGARGRLGSRPPEIEVLLAPAAVGLAVVACAAAAAFDHDVRGRTFSWRQPLSFLAGAALVVAAVPSLLAAGDGRFGMPRRDLVQPLRFLPPAGNGAGQRLLWVAAPADLPPGAWPLGPPPAGTPTGTRLGYAITAGDGPSIVDAWADDPGVGERQVASYLTLVADGQTDRVGHLLAPMGVRFVVVVSTPPNAAPNVAPNATANATNAGDAALDPVASASPALLAGLSSQLDLRRVPIDNRLIVYENTAWLPITAELDEIGRQASRQAGDDVLVRTDLTGAVAVLPVLAGHVGGRGPVATGTVYLARPFDDRWSLRVGAASARAQPAFGWATSFEVPAGGDASLRHSTPLLRRLALLLVVGGWLLVGRLTRPIDRTYSRRRGSKRVPSIARYPSARPSPTGSIATEVTGAGATGVAAATAATTDAVTAASIDAEPTWADDLDEGRAVGASLRVPDELALKWADDDRQDRQDRRDRP